MKQTKVLQIITLSEYGGAQKHIAQIIDHSAANIDFCLSYGGKGEAFSHLKCQKYPNKYLKRTINPVRDWQALKVLILLIREIKPDVVHCHSAKGGFLGRIAAKICGIKKIIYTVHGFVFKEDINYFLKIFYYYIEKLLARFFTNILICVSEEDLAIAKDRHFKKIKDIKYLPNGLDFSQYSKSKPKQKEQKQLKGLCIANFYQTKGHKYLVEAVNEISKKSLFTVDLIGKDGGELNKIKKLVRKNKLQDRLLFKGYQKNITNRLYQQYDFFILPSVKEGFPYVVLEALAAGLPVIASAVGGNKELIKNKYNGLLVKSQDSKKLREALTYMLNNFNSFAIDKKSLQAKYDIKQLTKKLNKLYV